MKYLIVEAPSPVELEKEVESRIEDGWKPKGGLCVVSSPPQNFTNPEVRFYQAMVKQDFHSDSC